MLLIPKYGYLAAAVITVITETFIFIYLFILARNIIKKKISYFNLIKCILSGLMMAAVLIIFHKLNIFALIIIGIIIYGGSLFTFKVLSKEYILSLIRH